MWDGILWSSGAKEPGLEIFWLCCLKSSISMPSLSLRSMMLFLPRHCFLVVLPCHIWQFLHAPSYSFQTSAYVFLICSFSFHLSFPRATLFLWTACLVLLICFAWLSPLPHPRWWSWGCWNKGTGHLMFLVPLICLIMSIEILRSWPRAPGCLISWDASLALPSLV